MLGLTLLVGGIAGYFIAEKLLTEKLIFTLMAGYGGAVLMVLICGLVKLDGSSKILLAFAIGGFILGAVFAWCNSNMVERVQAFMVSGLGAYLLCLGVASYLGGFKATSWSLYVYIGVIVIITAVRGHSQFKTEIQRKSAGETVEEPGEDAFGDQADKYTGAF
jgi:hypothetical protein